MPTLFLICHVANTDDSAHNALSELDFHLIMHQKPFFLSSGLCMDPVGSSQRSFRLGCLRRPPGRRKGHIGKGVKGMEKREWEKSKKGREGWDG